MFVVDHKGFNTTQISCVNHYEHHLIVVYCEFRISIYARLCPSTAGIQWALYSYIIIISSKPIV